MRKRTASLPQRVADAESPSGVWGWLWAFVVLEVILVIAFVPHGVAVALLDDERQIAIDQVGVEAADWIDGAGDALYDHIFEKTGLRERVYATFLPSTEEYDAKDGLHNMRDKLMPVVRDRLYVFFLGAYGVCRRLAAYLVWVPALIGLVIGAGFDGYTSWAIRRHAFRYSSPIRHRSGYRLIYMLFVIMAFALFIPIAVSPLFVLGIMSMGLVGFHLTVRYMQRQI